MALRPVPSEDSWPEEIAEDAIEEFDGVIQVLEPASGSARGEYDPRTGTRSPAAGPAVIIDTRAARIQHTRSTLDSSGASEWSTRRRYIFQMEIRPNDPPIVKGMVVRVLDGGRDAALQHYAFQVMSATNSSSAALRTIETISEIGTVK